MQCFTLNHSVLNCEMLCVRRKRLCWGEGLTALVNASSILCSTMLFEILMIQPINKRWLIWIWILIFRDFTDFALCYHHRYLYLYHGLVWLKSFIYFSLRWYILRRSWLIGWVVSTYFFSYIIDDVFFLRLWGLWKIYWTKSVSANPDNVVMLISAALTK